MRRLALLAAALAVACSSKKQGDTTPPAVPVISAPANGATIDAAALVAGQVAFSGTAEAGATVELQIDGTTAGTVVATAGAWSFAATLQGGGHTVRARAIDAAGNASAFCAAVAFTVDATRLATPIPAGSPAPVTSWGQSVPVTAADASGLGALFPGQANSWVLDPSFSLATGFGLQYANALLLYTGTPSSPVSHASLSLDLLANAFDPFLGDQAASEVAFLTPAFGTTDGVKTAAASDAAGVWLPPPISGTTSAYLNGTSDSRLSRALALAAGETYTFSWTHEAILLAGSLAGAPAASYQVVLRDPATGAVLGAPLFSSSANVARGPATPVTRSNLPASVVLSFELRSAASGYVQLDDVALATPGGPVALANGDFEAGLTGWQASSGAESQNVRSGARTVGAPGSALSVTRTFYAPPAASWGRMVDVFENTGTAAVTTTAVYVTTLGPVAGVLPCAAVTQPGAAVAWDCAATVRDVGVVFGSGTAYVADGDPFVFVVHDLTVPPGGKVALVHFVVQLGEAAGGPTSQAVDVPRGTADEAAAILAGFRTLQPYRADLEPGVIELVTNL